MKKGIIGIASLLAGAAGGAIGTERVIRKKVSEKQKLADKHLALFLMMNQWVKVKQEGKSLVRYFEKKKYESIAIYGMSYAGETLADELKGSNIKIAYGIDRNANNIYTDFEVVSPNDELESVDAVVVTSITYFEEIRNILEEKMDCPILSLEDVLYEI